MAALHKERILAQIDISKRVTSTGLRVFECDSGEQSPLR
jgi:hypothetical protein